MTLLAVERIKLFTTRSPWWCTIIAVVLTVGFAAMLAGIARSVGAEFPFSIGMAEAGHTFGLYVIIVMAALAVTTEYRFSTIRATFTAVPNRAAVLTAKGVVVGLLAGGIGLVAGFASWGIARLVHPTANLALDSAADWRAVAGVSLVFAAAAILSVGVGTLIRQSAGAISILLVWALVVESLVGIIPRYGSDITEWMPFVNASNFIMGASGPAAAQGPAGSLPSAFGPWGSLAYFAAIAIGVFVIGLVVAERRDA